MRRARRLSTLTAVLLSTLSLAPATGVASGAATRHHAPGAPRSLRVNDDVAPLAVTGAPRFGWVVVDADPDEVQHAYELIVADRPTTNARDPHVIFRSGKVTSAEQSHVVARGLRLAADHSYWWTVRTWDRADVAGPFAKPARFDRGLVDRDWNAAWIRRPGAQRAAYEDFSLLRTERTLGVSPIVRARVYAAAGQQFELHINGRLLAHGPSFSYPDEQYYETTDITHAVRAGERNMFGFVTHWSTPGQGRPASVPALIAHISVDHADGTREVITTDRSWQTRAGAWTQGHQRNEEGDFVEQYDARRDPAGWDVPGASGRGWSPAEVLGPHPTAPFRHLIAARTHIVEQRLAPKSLTRLVSGAWVADFGAVYAATPWVRLPQGRPGRLVTLVAGFLLEPDGSVSRERGTQSTDMSWQYVERAGTQSWRPFGYLAFRYLEIDGAGVALSVADVEVAARHASMPDEAAAQFRTSDAGMNAVWNLARRSALYDSQEQFLDTPTREKGQFLADAFDVSSAAMRAFGERALTEQALRDFAASQRRYWSDGRVNAVYPNGDGARDIPDFTEMYVEWVWRAYVDTGDRSLVKTLFPSCRRIADYLAAAIDPRTGLVTNIPGGDGDYLHGIVDWPMAMRYGYDMATAARTTENVLAVNAFRRVAEMAALVDPTRAAQWQQRAASLATAMQRRLTRPDGVFVDGLAPDGSQSLHASQHANAYALAYGLVLPAHRAGVAAYIASLGTAMGPMTADVLLRSLHQAGRDDALVRVLTDATRPGWAQILSRGATFTWESWNARDVPGDSESHAWGASVLAVLQSDVLGVTIAEPGASRIDVRMPSLSHLSAAGVVPTERGPVVVSWRRNNNSYSLRLTIPPNVAATVHLPDARGEHAVTIGSGSYTFPIAARSTRRHSGVSNGIWVAIVAAVLAGATLVVVIRRRRRVRGAL